MTITTRGLRKIAVDGHSYVWRARKTKCPCCRSRAVVIVDARSLGWKPGEGTGVFVVLGGVET